MNGLGHTNRRTIRARSWRRWYTRRLLDVRARELGYLPAARLSRAIIVAGVLTALVTVAWAAS